MLLRLKFIIIRHKSCGVIFVNTFVSHDYNKYIVYILLLFRLKWNERIKLLFNDACVRLFF